MSTTSRPQWTCWHGSGKCSGCAFCRAATPPTGASSTCSQCLSQTFVLWLSLTDVLNAHVRIDNSHTTPRASMHVPTVNVASAPELNHVHFACAWTPLCRTWVGLAGYRELVSVSILEGGAAHFPHVHTFFGDTGLTMVGFHLDAMGCGLRSEAYLCTVNTATRTVLMYVLLAWGKPHDFVSLHVGLIP